MTRANKNIIIGLSGTSLTPQEMGFINLHNPVGFILFARNCTSVSQVKKLTRELRRLSHDPLILIDQEGGRINRLSAFDQSACWPAEVFGAIAQYNLPLACYAVYLNYLRIGSQLQDLGINVNCTPVLDLHHIGANGIIGDRSFSSSPEIVSRLAQAVIYAMKACGIAPIIKHIPGHGRATEDSHHALPIIDTELNVLRKTDFRPFINFKDAPAAMTAHVLYTALDPTQPVTTSPAAIQYLRKELEFTGLLITDDLSMNALQGSIAERADAALQAGCDIILHCNGNIAEMEEAANVAYDLTPTLAERLVRLYHFDQAQPLSSAQCQLISAELEKIMQAHNHIRLSANS